jgi:hypothetical protein
LRVRVGLELELLTPAGKTRFDVAAALAHRVGGRVVFGLKHVVEGLTPDQRPLCALSLAARVFSETGEPLATMVDDVTIREHVGEQKASGLGVVIDDARISKWLEQRSFVADEPDAFKVLEPLVREWGGTLDAGSGAVRVVDLWGQVLAVVVDEPLDHHRVCEIVTRPLEWAASTTAGPPADPAHALLREALAAAADVGCTVPEAAALHLHVDATPWQTTPALCALVDAWDKRHAEIRARLKPNPRCKKLGPFPHDAARVAREAPKDLPFATLAAALKMAGAKKELDLNILGAIDRHPAQPTVEIRCLPMSLALEAVARSVDQAIAILDEIRAPP